jgi:hypothetical protein
MSQGPLKSSDESGHFDADDTASVQSAERGSLSSRNSADGKLALEQEDLEGRFIMCLHGSQVLD